ncbi:Splicing factor [Coemansia interrupta]|uniref:Splicing factor n=1 Tax=Coemansia interrupta TaxID=1126814 RepID=A0A9W8HMI0_9FUNG|nr:Splicing factor [Coemansia interrupta]
MQWIELLRPVGDVESLRSARTYMQRYVAVPEDVWTGWIDDEKRRPEAFCDPKTVRYIMDLFDEMVGECVSVTAWQKYLDFVREVERKDQDANVRSASESAFGTSEYLPSVLQRAVAATEFDYRQSQALWIQYKDYLEHNIDRCNVGDGNDDNDGDDGNRRAPINLLQSVFLERLGQAHAELESTFSMYSQFITKYMNASYEQQMVHASGIVSGTRQACRKRDESEAALDRSGHSWSSFSAYIDMLKRDKMASRRETLMLYERAIVHHRYSAEVWDEYIAYTSRCMPETDPAPDSQPSGLSVALRAAKCCPWSGKIWAQLVYATFSQHGYEAASAVYDQAVSTHAVTYSMAEFSQIATALVNIARQRSLSQEKPQFDNEKSQELLDVCKACLSTAYALPLDTADPMLRLERYCTGIVADMARSTEAARKMWMDICSSRKVCAEAWVLFAEFEQTHGSVEGARNIYRRASQRRLDNLERVFSAWTAFEHLYGDTQTMWTAKRRRVDDGDSHIEVSDRPGLENKVVFISGLPLSCTEADIRAFIGDPDTVRQIEMLANKEGQFRGQAKATLASTDAVIAALDRSGQKLSDSFVSVHIFKQHGHSQKPRSESTVKVSGFSAETGNKKLEEIAKGSGVAVVRVRRNQSGDVAFVAVRTQRDAHRAASALDGSVVDGKTLSAQVDRDGTGGRASGGRQRTSESVAKDAEGTAESAVQKMSTKADSGATPMLVPRRAASKKQQPSKRLNLARKSADGPAGSKNGGPETRSKQAERTNDDFRRLFMKEGTK